MTATRHTIRITKEAPRRLLFEVLSSNGERLARSVPFASICKLEAGLAVLTAAARQSDTAILEPAGDTTSVRPEGRRAKVHLEGTLSPETRSVLFAGLIDAVVVDDRPPSERRHDLSGGLCDIVE